ncbi:MAG: class I SAM-dependent methyltransferase [Dehalococcoidia bacterium]|nr:class I SAM-dependent methyltransferase [Dehalococcoidia bacterium]
MDELLQPELARLLALGWAELRKDYHGINARLYDSVQAGSRDVEYYLETIGPGPAAVLELGSGTGRAAIPIAEAGHTVYALDNSPDMHEVMRGKVPAPVSDRIVQVEADMVDFSLGMTFDFVILGLNTVFALVEDASRRGCFRSVSRHLKPEGRFILDFMLPSASLMSNKDGSYDLSVYQESAGCGCVVVTYNRYDPGRRLSVLNFLTLEVIEGRFCNAYITPAAEYYPSVDEIRQAIESTGMEVIETLGNYDGRPFSDTAEDGDVIMVARLKLPE